MTLQSHTNTCSRTRHHVLSPPNASLFCSFCWKWNCVRMCFSADTSGMPFTPLATGIQYWTRWFYIPSQLSWCWHTMVFRFGALIGFIQNGSTWNKPIWGRNREPKHTHCKPVPTLLTLWNVGWECKTNESSIGSWWPLVSRWCRRVPKCVHGAVFDVTIWLICAIYSA